MHRSSQSVFFSNVFFIHGFPEIILKNYSEKYNRIPNFPKDHFLRSFRFNMVFRSGNKQPPQRVPSFSENHRLKRPKMGKWGDIRFEDVPRRKGFLLHFFGENLYGFHVGKYTIHHPYI